MNKLLLCAVALVLMAADAAAAPPSGWGRLLTEDIGIATGRRLMRRWCWCSTEGVGVVTFREVAAVPMSTGPM